VKKLLPILFIALSSIMMSTKVLSLPNCSFWWSTSWSNCVGEYLWKDTGDKYIGGWLKGEMHGQGTFTYVNGDTYVGYFENGKNHGHGTYTYVNGDTYVGQFINNTLISGTHTRNHGQWKGDKYIGEFGSEWEYRGQGTYYMSDGFRLVGKYKNGVIEEGRMIHTNGNLYVGEFGKNWEYSGQGSYTYANGDKYVGKWKEMKRNGQGIFTSFDGSSEEGFWKDGVLQDTIPSNAYASGSSWKCNSGYTKSGKNCIENPVDTQVYSAASGSGFAVTPDGYVVTNYHVIKGCTDVYIHDKGDSILSTIVTFDPNNDIALLKGNFKPKRFYPLSRKSTKLLTEIFVAGHPFGRDISTSVKVTKGIVSSLTGVANNFSNLQIDASLQPGNSGGPIMNNKGNVIGVAVAKLDLDTIVEEYGVVPENVNFGVKANIVINIMESESIPLPEPNSSVIPMSELGEMITDGTYYLSCWMTMAQINQMRETKVIFKNFN
jgi:hypothetical protein